ncbi:MAG: DUF4189 domain-containing protein [Spirochaetes bacterium]|nr:DUF4189 domain-containing protein [Spirochaetota bacterium]
MKRTIIVLALVAVPAILFAASSVYFCPQTGAVGIAWGGNNLDQRAWGECTRSGGRACSRFMYRPGRGFGSFAKGQNYQSRRWIQGIACGYRSQVEADNRALYECRNGGAQNCNVHHR